MSYTGKHTSVQIFFRKHIDGQIAKEMVDWFNHHQIAVYGRWQRGFSFTLTIENPHGVVITEFLLLFGQYFRIHGSREGYQLTEYKFIEYPEFMGP